MRELIAIDLCCGAGGWGVAARGLPIRIVAAFDIWQPACMTYSLNHPRTSVVRCDLTRAPLSRSLGRVDLVLGGIPCQWLSDYRRFAVRARVSQGERDRNRELLDAVLLLVAHLQPRWWCLEDVVALRKELPILTPYRVIDSRHYSGQRRKRIYVGKFPAPERTQPPDLLQDHLRPGPYRVGPRLFGREPRTHRSFSKASCLAWMPQRKSPTVCALGSRRDAEAGIVDDVLPGGLRQLEWQEAAVIQGYPENYLFYGSPTDVGQMIANSVQIDTARAILQAIVRDSQLSTLNSRLP